MPQLPHQQVMVRVGKFVTCGILAYFVQVGMLTLALAWELPEAWANILAIVSGTQASYIFNTYLTWSDRKSSGFTDSMLRWLRFTAILSVTNLLNEGIFLVARHAFPLLVATTIGSAVVAILNFFCGDRIIFRHVQLRSAVNTLTDIL